MVDSKFVDTVWLEAIPKLVAEKRGILFETALELVKEQYDNIGPERLEWYNLKYWLKKFNLKEDSNLLSELKHLVKTYPEVSIVLKRLRLEGYRLAIITNSPCDFLNVTIQQAGIDSFFERVFSLTTEFGKVGKTENVYREILGILKISPSEMVHIGDSWIDDFEAPRKIGITSFYLDRKCILKGDFIVKNLEEFLEELRLLEKNNLDVFYRFSIDI